LRSVASEADLAREAWEIISGFEQVFCGVAEKRVAGFKYTTLRVFKKLSLDTEPLTLATVKVCD
jgi:hypothetical protein